MKIFTYLTLVLGFFMSSTYSFAQTLQEREAIKNSHNKEKVKLLTQQIDAFLAKQKEEVKRLIAAGYQETTTKADGTFMQLVGAMEDGTPLYNMVDNNDSGIATRAADFHTNGSLGLDINGEGMVVYVWDGGRVRMTHQEFSGAGKIVQADDASEPTGLNGQSFHATHVTGTFAANGTVPGAQGMAPAATIQAYGWTDDLAEINTAASNGALLSNHSYGGNINTYPDWAIGAYIGSCVNYDAIMDFYGTYLHITSVGNNGVNDVANGAPLEGNSAFDKLLYRKVLKNNLVVANGGNPVFDANGNVTSIDRNGTSSEGPTDDLRVKPDIAGIGTSVYSCTDANDTDYSTFSGSSMAAPTVSGTLLLVQQYYNQVNGNFMKAYSLKGLALHTAVDALATGPDAEVGWGLINAKDAADVITNNGTTSLLEELTLQNGSSYSITVASDGTEPLLASISWFDVANNSVVANSASGANNGPKTLINDLDIRVTKDANTFYPWRLTGVTTNANDGDNDRDPFERVDINNPTAGNYTITVTHKGTLDGGNAEDYTLIVSGASNVSLSTDEFITDALSIYPNPTKDILNVTFAQQDTSKTQITINDIQGRNVFNKNYTSTSSIFNESINVSAFSDGVYLMTIQDGNRTITKKIVKK